MTYVALNLNTPELMYNCVRETLALLNQLCSSDRESLLGLKSRYVEQFSKIRSSHAIAQGKYVC